MHDLLLLSTPLTTCIFIRQIHIDMQSGTVAPSHTHTPKGGLLVPRNAIAVLQVFLLEPCCLPQACDFHEFEVRTRSSTIGVLSHGWTFTKLSHNSLAYAALYSNGLRNSLRLCGFSFEYACAYSLHHLLCDMLVESLRVFGHDVRHLLLVRCNRLLLLGGFLEDGLNDHWLVILNFLADCRPVGYYGWLYCQNGFGRATAHVAFWLCSVQSTAEKNLLPSRRKSVLLDLRVTTWKYVCDSRVSLPTAPPEIRWPVLSDKGAKSDPKKNSAHQSICLEVQSVCLYAVKWLKLYLWLEDWYSAHRHDPRNPNARWVPWPRVYLPFFIVTCELR